MVKHRLFYLLCGLIVVPSTLSAQTTPCNIARPAKVQGLLYHIPSIGDHSISPGLDSISLGDTAVLAPKYASTLSEVPAYLAPSTRVLNASTTPDKATEFKSYWMLRTNLLYAAALLPNIVAEYHFHRNWSAAAGVCWSWWQTRAPQYWSYRIQSGELELRHRVPEGFFGAYVRAGSYDLRLFPRRLTSSGYLSDFSYSFGLTLGNRRMFNPRWGMEFSLGVGYIGGRYRTYDRTLCIDGFRRTGSGHLHYLGLTRIALSLIYSIGGKEGRR